MHKKIMYIFEWYGEFQIIQGQFNHHHFKAFK